MTTTFAAKTHYHRRNITLVRWFAGYKHIGHDLTILRQLIRNRYTTTERIY